MFAGININDPFYTQNNFSYSSSDSDSESDFEYEYNMATNATNTAKAGSAIHTELRKLVEAKPPSQDYFENNKKAFKAMFGVPAALWAAYKTASDNYDPNEADTDKLLAAAKNIGSAAIAIRKAGVDSAASILTAHNPMVNITGVTADESAALVELHALVLKKMTDGTQQAGNALDADKMLDDFIHDMKLAKESGTYPEKWSKNARTWKCLEHAKQKNRSQEVDIAKWTAVDGKQAEFAKFIEKFNEYKDIKPPNSEVQRVAMSNKFSIDVFAVVINKFKSAMGEEATNTFDHLMYVLGRVSLFMRGTSISKTAWAREIASEFCAPYKPFLTELESNILFENPAKMTKGRLFSCVATMFPAPDPTILFSTYEKGAEVPKLLAKIYGIEKKFGEVGPMKNETSTSEHLMHLLCTLGANYSYAYNRNSIDGSIRSVKFTCSGN